MNEEKLKALDAVLAQIEKAYGKGAIMKLGQDAGNTDIEVIPTGCLSLDLALGVGGLPRGRMVEIYGPESSGKTTVALHAVAEAQKMGGIAAFVDAEHALDPVYAKKLGVNLDELFAVSDIVTLHCPLMDATRGLVDAARLASMKPGAILVNAARGGIVDETALAAALERGVIRGAAIDNFESEIPSPGNPLLRLSPEARRRVLFSPHLAGVTRAAFARLIRQAIGNLENSLRGLPPQFSVNGLSSIRPSA